MPLTVRNPLPNPVVYSRKGEEDVIWNAAGDLQGEDIQQVSDDFASRNDFLRSVTRGVLIVEDADDEEILARINKKVLASGDQNGYAKQEGQTAQDALRAFDKVPDRSIISMKCVGPAQRGGGQCGSVVMVAPAFAKEYPPLCPPHGPLQPHFERNAKGEWARKSEATSAS